VAKDETPLRPDIQAAASIAGTTLGAKREIRKLASYLREGELVTYLASGTYGDGTGIIALTDRRLLFLKDGVMKQVSEDFPFDRISSIQWSSGPLMGKIIVFVAGAKAEIVNVPKRIGKVIVDTARNRISVSSAPAAPGAPAAAGPTTGVPAGSAASGSEDILDQIGKLGALRDSGVLSEQEFDEKKTQLLVRL
jgi:hypothetical protein